MSGYYSSLKWRKRQQCLRDKISPDIYHWLFDPESLTAKIIKSCNGKFSVHLIDQGRATPTLDEIRALGVRYRCDAIIRQVILFCDDKPWVYARSVIPVTTLKGSLKRLAYLGNKPLGAVLFADTSIIRSEVEVTSIDSSHEIYKCVDFKKEKKIWGRRSVFSHRRKRLLVSEFFLPDCYDLKK